MGQLVPFVGAGLSRLAGCPGWAEFADGALEQLHERGILSYAQIEQLRALSPRVKLSIARKFAEGARVNLDCAALLHPQSDWNRNPTGRQVYGALSAISRVFVTTNYDRWLDATLPPPEGADWPQSERTGDAPIALGRRRLFHRPDQFNAANLSVPDSGQGVVFHLHGCIAEDDGHLVLTTPDYLRHYANDRKGDRENPVLTFLNDLFRTRTVLFLGYGLEDLEILEFLIVKARGARTVREDAPPTERIQQRHFLLQGFFSYERELMQMMGTYYEEFGIQLLPYQRDERNWCQLSEVVEDLARKLPKPTNSATVLTDVMTMDQLLDG